ncbi:uncharacterized protein LOC141705836 [Apium graveolens]|uniref:uncharacterized protein LOC141705836 n=1 Tax=Apium graveolens TaxID=4045 RepID=UPI003D7A87A8
MALSARESKLCGLCVWVWILVYYSFGFGVVYGHRLRWLTELSKGIYVHLTFALTLMLVIIVLFSLIAIHRAPRDPCRSKIPLDSYSYFLRSLVEICLTKPEFCESDRTCQAADLHVIKSSCCESSPGSLDCRAVFLHSMHSDLMKVTTVCVMSMVSLIILNVVIYWVFGTSTEDNFIRRYVRALEGWHVFQHYILERVPPAA